MTPSKLPHVIAVALCILAFLNARTVTRELTWPAFDVQYREMAGAQTVLDGNPWTDPSYRGESSWYNPMSAWILAVSARVTHAPIPIVAVRIGPFINLLAPIAFYLLAVAWLEPWAALAALGAFLFLSGSAFPFTDAATYSPWFAPEAYGQGLFYLALLWAHRTSGQTPVRAGAVILGVLLGLIFLVHTAPALILGGVLVVLVVLEVSSTRRAGPALRRFVAILGVALVVGAPIAVSVIGRYRAHIVNAFPSASPNPIFGSLTGLAVKLALATPLLVAIVAFLVRAIRKSPASPRVLNAWLIATVASSVWVGLDLVAARTGFAFLPRLPVPGFHFVCYALALASLGFGIAVGDLATWGARRLPSSRIAVPRAALVVALLGVVLGTAAPRYLRRPDVTDLLDEARVLQSAIPAGLYAWVRSSTAPEDVFLCTDAESLFVISPAGRKVVATNRYFSNPFVDWAGRDKDRDAMFAALARGDLSALTPLASKYGVRWIVVANGMNDDLRRLAGVPKAKIPALTPEAVSDVPGITRAWSDERYAVFLFTGA